MVCIVHARIKEVAFAEGARELDGWAGVEWSWWDDRRRPPGGGGGEERMGWMRYATLPDLKRDMKISLQ